jgi:hypothetical protein
MRHDTPVDTPASEPEPAKAAAVAKKTIGGGKKKVAPKTRASTPKKPLGKKRTP